MILKKIAIAFSVVSSLVTWTACSSSNPADPGNGSNAPQDTIALSDGTYAHITSVNAEFNPAHVSRVEVHPGDVVSLTADVLTVSSGRFSPQNEVTESFSWSSDYGENDRCDASTQEDCIQQSNFETTNYGVNYYVPYQMSSPITVTLRHVAHPEWTDTITLHSSIAVAPTTIVTDPADYPYAQLDSSLALAGHGRWVVIGGTRHFVPYTTGEDWAPFQNGSWAWVDGEGWTWQSNDPWGWYTDHYGVWRHHSSYGWTWVEFGDRHYDPAPVSWIYTDSHLGWYPYNDRYRLAYSQGRDYGFDDGYWGGFSYGDSYDSNRDRCGFSFVEYGNFTAANLFEVRIRDRDDIDRIYRDGYRSRRFGSYPGAQDREGSRRFVEGHGFIVPTTTAREFRVGDRDFRTSVRLHERTYSPIEPRGIRDERLNRPISVGSVVDSVEPSGRVHSIPPTRNGMGIGEAPRRRNPDGARSAPMPPRTTRPAEANPNLPTRRPDPRPVQPAPRPQPMPEPRPQPAPQPRPQPMPQPAPQPRPQPVPQPRPQPAPQPRPQPVPQPRPQPVPQPRPQPMPQPRPQPAPPRPPRR